MIIITPAIDLKIWEFCKRIWPKKEAVAPKIINTKEKPNEKFVLQDKDIVLVKQILGYQEPVRISIKGQVNFPQNVIIEFKNTTFDQLLSYVGGLTKYANLQGSFLKRKSKVIVLDFTKIKNTETFENGDEIFIGSDKGTVSTVGAVENESNFIWREGIRAKEYIKNSGGKEKEGAKAYVTHPNGKTKKIGIFNNPLVLPNSIITVNRKIKKEEGAGDFLTKFNSTFGLIATTLTTLLLASKL